ncbi:DNA polymerase III subunit alpha [Bacillus sp. NRRL B-14911]|nr:DNA polymerase III subunit alpha [Bacillus sp. NRRL B-14911]
MLRPMPVKSPAPAFKETPPLRGGFQPEHASFTEQMPGEAFRN